MYKLYQLYRTHQEKALTFADQALVSGTNFITSLVYARLLGLESYGAFVLGWMIILFASTFQQAFIFSPMANANALLPAQQQQRYLNHLFLINLLFTTCCALLIMVFTCILYYFFKAEYTKEILYTLPVAAFTFLNYDFFRKKFLLQNHSHATLIIDGSFTVLLSVGIVALYQINAISITSILLSISISYFAATGIAIFIAPPFETPVHLSISIIQEHWRQGKWLLATALLQWFSGNYFLIAAASILGTRDIGIVRIAQNTVGILNILFIAMESYIPISASKIFHKNGVHALFNYLKQVTWKGLLITMILCAAIAFFAKPIVHQLYGEEYMAYSFVVQSFALFYVLVFIALPLRFAIRTLEHNHHIFIGYLISASFSLLCAAPIINRYGLNGVLIGIFATQLLTQLWYVFSLKNYLYEYYSFSTWKS